MPVLAIGGVMVAGSTARAAPAASATATKTEKESDFSMISPLQTLGCRKETPVARIYSVLPEFSFRDPLRQRPARGQALTAARHTLNVLTITPLMKGVTGWKRRLATPVTLAPALAGRRRPT